MGNKNIFKNKYDKITEQIYEYVGKQQNFSKVYHCITRLRFTIIDKNQVNLDAIKKLVLVKGTNWNGNELQIIIGSEVEKIKDALDKLLLRLNTKNVEQNLIIENKFGSPKKVKSKKRFLTAISAIMVPTLPVFITIGMLLGIKAIFVQIGIVPALKLSAPISEQLQTMDIWPAIFHAVTEVAFKFLGIFIGYNTMKYLKGNTVMSILIGLAVANPFMFEITQSINNPLPANWTLFKIGNYPVEIKALTNSILPFIAANVAYFYLDKWIKTWMPSIFDIIFRPFITFTIIAFGTFFVIGPVLNIVETMMAVAVSWLGNVPWGIGVAIFALSWQPFVLTGTHAAIAIPVTISLSKGEPQLLSPAIMYGVYGQLGAMIAVLIRTKNAQLRKVTISNLPAGFIGVTEPIMYGVNLPKIQPFIAGMLGAGIAGIFSGNMNVKLYTLGGYGIFQTTGYIPGGPWNVALFLISLSIALGSSILLGILLYTERTSEKKQLVKLNYNLTSLYAFVSHQSKKQAKANLKFQLESIENLQPDILNHIKKIENNYAKILSLKTKLVSYEEKYTKKFDKIFVKQNKLTTKYQQQQTKLKKQLLFNEQKAGEINQNKFLKRETYLVNKLGINQENWIIKNQVLEAKLLELQQRTPQIIKVENTLQTKLLDIQKAEQILNNWQEDQLLKVSFLLSDLVNQTQIKEFGLFYNSYYNAVHSLDINYEINSPKIVFSTKKIKQEVKEKVYGY